MTGSDVVAAYGGGLVQFGAGNIGRSFIGQLFARSGMPVIFVDVDEVVIAELNRRHEYPVVIRRQVRPDETLTIEGVAAVDARDTDAVAEAVAGAALVATSVGARALEKVYPVLADGIRRRFEAAAADAPGAADAGAAHPAGASPLDIIIAENLPNGAEIFAESLGELLPNTIRIGREVGLVETSIGKMVPLITEADRREDPLRVFAEEYNTLIVDRPGFRGSIPDVPGLWPVENIQAYVDRKLYIHNLGHAAVAYLGNRIIPGATFIAECMEVPEVRERAAAAMHASAEALHRHYPEDLPAQELAAHVEDLLQRFGNHALKDTVYRVGRDVPRKLARDDRLVGAVRRCIHYGIDPAPIAECVAAALRFGATDENGAPDRGAVEVRGLLERNGLDAVLTEVCGLDLHDPPDLQAAEAIRRAVAVE